MIAGQKDEGYGESLRGFYLVRLGNFDSAVAKQTALPQKRRELLDHAKYEFIAALTIWKQHGAQSSGSRSQIK
ncbi:MAG: hypothetical protein ABJA02_03875 [Acidobacteriota bacterium]